MKINLIMIIYYIKKYFRRFLKLEFLIICLLSVFIFPIIRPIIIGFVYLLFSKYISQSVWYEYMLYIFSSIVCLIVFGLITAIFSDMYLSIKEYFKQDNIKYSDIKLYKSKKVYTFFLLDLESWARDNNLYNKVPDNLWKELRVAKGNLDFKFISYNRISFRYLLKRYRKINYFMKINTKIFKLLRNNKSKSIIFKIVNRIGKFIKIMNIKNK